MSARAVGGRLYVSAMWLAIAWGVVALLLSVGDLNRRKSAPMERAANPADFAYFVDEQGVYEVAAYGAENERRSGAKPATRAQIEAFRLEDARIKERRQARGDFNWAMEWVFMTFTPATVLFFGRRWVLWLTKKEG